MMRACVRTVPRAVGLRQQQRHASLAKVIFTANGLSDVGTREGNVKSFGEHHGNLNLKLEKHPGHGGKGGGTNPEELFACGYSACFGEHHGDLNLKLEKHP